MQEVKGTMERQEYIGRSGNSEEFMKAKRQPRQVVYMSTGKNITFLPTRMNISLEVDMC